MTDHLPNDLSHLSDAEFNALCPQGEHAPGPQPLSPGAQAVLDAFNNRGLSSREWHDGKAASLKLAAALCAAVHGIDYITSEEILSIADELEGAN
jgi:hypothetical protein